MKKWLLKLNYWSYTENDCWVINETKLEHIIKQSTMKNRLRKSVYWKTEKVINIRLITEGKLKMTKLLKW
jgi:hypothetical protein